MKRECSIPVGAEPGDQAAPEEKIRSRFTAGRLVGTTDWPLWTPRELRAPG